MMVGRAAECGVVDALLRDARAGRSGGLVVRGEPGIGKTTLLTYAAGRAAGMTVLRTRGVEPETDIGYAALHQLLQPVLDRIPALPDPQARALGIVFGRADGPAPDRFLVALAVLSLLSEIGADRPVLCVVDDAHWIDDATAWALAFVARRLGSEPAALIMAARTGQDRPLGVDDLPTLPLPGLDEAGVRDLLAASGAPVSADRVAALLRATGGNPLAIRELPADPGDPVHLADGLCRAFLARAERHGDLLPLLLLAAADGTGRLDVLGRAARAVGLDPAPLLGDRLDDLLAADGDLVAFRHPLMRAAVYHGASAADRRRAHAAMAAAWAGDLTGGERRAWHLGRAATGPDETAADALEDAATAALRRTGAPAAAAALQRAAELSMSAADRARRAVAAAEAWWSGGDAARARHLLDLAESQPRLDPGTRLDAITLRALVEVRAGAPADAIALVCPAIPAALAQDRTRALRLLMLLGEASYQANGGPAFAQAQAAVAGMAAGGDDDTDVLARFYRTVHRARAGADFALSTQDRQRLDAFADPVRLAWAGGMAYGIGEPDLGRSLHQRSATLARRLGQAGTLAWVLDYLIADELGRSRYDAAESLAEEGARFAAETGQPNIACRHRATLATVAAVRGRAEQARQLADAVLAEASERGLVSVAATTHRALALLDLVAGRPAEALARLSMVDRGDATHPGIVLQAVPDRAEAAALAGVPDRVSDDAVRFAAWADSTGSPHLMALAARCAALLGSPAAAEAAFLRAVELHRKADHPMEYARTELLFGEHLRRRRQRRDARVRLRTALDVFAQLGAEPWAERARAELRAAGERVAGAGAAAEGTLTPQEARIVAAVRDGLTNREIAAQLFLSPRTVDYHLRKVFQKLGISSRTQLLRGDPGA